MCVAWEFVGLPLDAQELLLKLDSYVKAKFEADRNREQGLVDRDTGLYNEKGLLRRATEMGSDAYRHNRALACVVFGLDVDVACEPDSWYVT